MDRIAQASADERAELFRSAAIQLRPERSPALVEKDFWVCWSLHRLFEVLQFRPQLIFKGGTSLSKAYNAIERFSEDVDLSLSPRDLGFAGDRNPEEPGISGKEVRRRIKALIGACGETIRDRLLPTLRDDFTSVIGPADWTIELVPGDLLTTLNIAYPRSDLGDSFPAAIRPAIRLEMGARSDDWPVEDREIRPYAAETFPAAFSRACCRVRVLDATRTFWEKATLLHAECHRPAAKALADGMSRHYYDIYQLSRQEIGRQALGRPDLLARVVAHKQLFYPAAWAHYETATTGSFRLIPPDERMASLRADYARMREMIFGEAPPWEEIVHSLRETEQQINGK
jgi:hypothetical protein